MDEMKPKEKIETKENEYLKSFNPKKLTECKELDSNFNGEKYFEKINVKIFNLLNRDFEIPLNIDKNKVKAKNFIFTDNAIKKLKEIKYYISHNYPVLLEGPTGTAKSISVLILCEEMGMDLKLKRFNLSSETKTADLFGRYVGDPDSFSGISFQEGIFIDAFKNGYTLLLDEINLASNQVLQSFEECLDSHKISCEIPGMPWKEIEMGENFNLIATQNPNKGLFANKRQELGKKFLSRFHVINFDSFQKNELLEIAQGLGVNYNIDQQILKELVDFHDKWSNLPERKDDILCFTIREIEATINAINKGENIQEAILSIYGARYKKKEYEKLKSILRDYPALNVENKKSKIEFDNEFLYITPSLENALKAIKLSFDNYRHVMVVGDEGTGKTYLAKYLAEYRDKLTKNEIEYDEGIYYCECTEDLKCSDLIGNQYPSLNSSESENNFQQLMKWEDGFLTSAIINGKCCILDNIEEAPATITERLNGLLDKKLEIEKELIFEIPECPQKNEVKINKNFRLLCICNYNSISKMSPAFLNRFDIITLEDQIKPIFDQKNSKKYFLELIDTLMKQHSFYYESNMQLNEEEIKKHEKKKRYQKYMDLSDLDFNIGKKNLNFNYRTNANLNELIYKKIIENKNDDLSIYDLSLFCRAMHIFMKELDPNQEIDIKRLINYAYQLTLAQNIEDDKIIEDFIYQKFLQYETEVINDNKFFFQESPKLKSFMAKLLAASMINLHLCIKGKTGVGKTSCAREFSRIRAKCMKLSKDFYMHSFHSNTKSNHFYGNINMKNNQIDFINGSLLNAMEKGTTFIADEMNLAPEIVMKSLVPALELNLNSKIYIPGIKKKIQINQKFFFISCQNDFTTTGRNSLPKLLAKKLKFITYPEPPIEDIQKICRSINLELYSNIDDEQKQELNKNGENIARYMKALNELKLSYIPNWSIRDITKVLKRVQFQSLEKNQYKYKNISLVDNIIFYTLSGIYKKDLKDKIISKNLLEKLSKILKDIFNLSEAELQNIKDIFNNEAKIEGNFICKGKCGISLKCVENLNNNKKIFHLPSLYNELFQILLAHDEEPILIIGESGYKTYLAQLLESSAKLIQLNAETTIGQLLGSTIFLSDTEVKTFYLKQIYNILRLNVNESEIKMVQNWANFNDNDEKKILEQQSQLKQKIEKEIFVRGEVYETIKKFKPILNNLKEKLIRNNYIKKNNLNNINLEFKPGLILNSILSGKSLILKYLSNLPTVVLERFNELFSGKHNLTLTEDIHDTFTKEGNKELTNLGENFRIFATCSLGEQNKLSEAVLSRFTVICTDKYKQEEIKDALKSFLSENRLLDFNENCIDEVINFFNNIKNNSLSLMINALSLAYQKEIFQENDNISRVNILSFILYRLIYGISHKFKSNPDSIYYDIEEKLKSFLVNFKGEIIPEKKDVDEEPLFGDKDNKFIESKYNGLKIEHGIGQNDKHKNFNTLAFTKTFTEMVDYIFLGIATNTPIILEGGTGLGKQTAINYVADKLNFKIMNFIITQSTKVEDLLGRNQIIRKDGQIKIEFCQTKILKALVGKEGENNNVIIVFHNLNKASSALMESLCSIFDKNQANILRPDGESKLKVKTNLIGIINSQSNIAIKDKLPLSLINCVFYYILPRLSPYEMKKTIIKKFTTNNLSDEAEDFVDCFNKSREFSYMKGNISYFSLNDITKYILFRRYTKDSLDKSIILQIIFAFRFIQNEFIKEILNELGFLTMKLNPIFKLEEKVLSVSFKNKKFKQEIKYPYIDQFKINKEKTLKKINRLNTKQKHCLLFLVLSILCKRACIIQGDTASGKTHLVRLLAEMVGQKLIVYQMNKETGLSIFTGQSTLLNNLEKDEILKITEYFKILSKNEIFKKYLDEFFINYDYIDDINEKWSVIQFKNLIKKIREYIKINNASMKEKDYFDFKKIANDLEELIQPYKRFKKHESIFIEALEKGYWVLIDGIESANPVISDKIIRLCDENAELDLTEFGENIIFSNNSSDKKINPYFHLFINYNPLNKSNNNQLNEMFLNKCITFTLSPMDVDVESSAQIIYGYLKNTNSIDEILCQQISSKVALIHQNMNKKIEENQEFFSGGVQFTGRIIKYISEELAKSKDSDNLCDHLVNSLYLNYINSINNKNNKNNIKEVKNIIKNNLKKICSFDTGEKNLYLKYSEVFIILRNIQKITQKNLQKYDFDFINLLKLIKKVEINDLSLIHYHIEETIKILDEFVGNLVENKIKYFDFYFLIIIKKLIKNVLDYTEKNSKYNLVYDFTLDDEEELLSKNILKKEIAKINLVLKLEKFNLTDNFIYLPNELIEYINSIKKLIETNDIKDVYEHFKIVRKLLSNKLNITKLFPFNQILLEKLKKNITRIRMFKIMFLIYKLIENKIDFEFGYNSDIIKFNFINPEIENFKNILIKINLNKDFYFKNSKILFKKGSESTKIIETSENIEAQEIISTTNWFYLICSNIIDNKIQINEDNKKIYMQKIFDIMDYVTENNINNVDEITEEFEKKIKVENRTYSITKLISKQERNFFKSDDNLIIKIWFLILFYDQEKLDSITPSFCIPFEKDLLIGIKEMYENVEIKYIQKIIYFTDNMLELKSTNSNRVYGSNKTFLYQIQAGFFNSLFIKDKDKKDFYNQIKEEIEWYNKFDSPFNKFWSIDKSILCLNSENQNLQSYVDNIQEVEEYKNKLIELINTINSFRFIGNEKNKEKLINLLRSKLNNPTKEVYDACKENIDNFCKNSENKSQENKIINFPETKSNNFQEENIYVICLKILKTYSLQHKKLTKIFKNKKDILTEIFQLDKEIEIVSDILGKYALEKGEFLHMYKNQVMGIIRAYILFNIIKMGKEKQNIEKNFKEFLNLTEIINDQTGGRGDKYFDKDIFNWTKNQIETDLEEYLLIPKFEPKDFLYLFLITYTEEINNNQVPKINNGFLFQHLKNKELGNILFHSLKSFDEQNFNTEEKNSFKDFIEKIARSLFKNILPEKCDNNFDKLPYFDLCSKLAEEKKELKSQYLYLKNNNKREENLEMKLEIIDGILKCFYLTSTYEYHNSKSKLNYEDIYFFQNKNWKNELMSRYPGMLYWLLNNYSFYNDLIIKKDSTDCFITKDDQISFWYFQIRVFSNIRNFAYTCYSKKIIKIHDIDYNVGKQIEGEYGDNSLKNEIEEEFIKKSIIDLIKNNKPININWINLVLDKIPQELNIMNKKVRYFYEFFANILADSKGYQKTIKNKIIIKYMKKVFDLIFENKIEEFFKKDMNSNDELIKFINKPQYEIIEKIKERVQKDLLKKKIEEHIKNTDEIFEYLKNSMPDIIDKLNDIVNEKTKEYHNKYINKKNESMEIEKKNIEKNLEEHKKKILSCLNIIKATTIQDQQSLEEKIKELDNLLRNKNYFNYLPEKEIICYKITIKVPLKLGLKYEIKIKNKNNKMEKIEFDSDRKEIYLQPSLFNEKDISHYLIFQKNILKVIPIRDKTEIDKIEIYSFDKQMSFNEEVRERKIADAESKLTIIEAKITFNGEKFNRKKLDDFLKLIKDFDISKLKITKKYDYELKSEINKIIFTINNLEEYLTLKDDGNDKNLEIEVIKLKNLLNKFAKELKNNADDITTVLNENNKIKDEKVFTKDHDKIIAKFKEPPQGKQHIYISNIDYLHYPMISDDGKKIIFSSKKFKMFLGSFIPSSLSNHLIIKLLNIKGNEINCNIKNIKDSDKNIVTLGESDSKTYLEIYININDLKAEKNYYKKNLDFKLEINSNIYQKIEIPFNLSFNVVPFSILFSSINYKLNYDLENKEFNLVSDKLYTNSRINFTFNYLFISENKYNKEKNQLSDNIVDFNYSLESLENNDSIKPYIQTENNKLILEIPKNDDDKIHNLNFILRIYFSTTFFINVKFITKIFRFDFEAFCYSYNKKRFINDKIVYIYIDKNSIPYEYLLHFKIEKNLPYETDFQFKFNFPEGIEKIRDNFEEKKSKRNGFIFSIKLNIKKEFESVGSYFTIKIIGNQVEKEFEIRFINIKNTITNKLKDLYSLPLYKYSPGSNEFIEENRKEKDSIYITPFNSYIPYVINLYPSNRSGVLEPIYEPGFKFYVLYYSNETKILEKNSNFIYNDKIIKIIGVFNEDKWYPFPEMEIPNNNEDIFQNFEYLQYENNSIEKAKRNIKSINKHTDYWYIPQIMKIYSNNEFGRNYFIKFIDILPLLIKKELNEEYQKLIEEKEEILFNIYPIIANNLIYKLYGILKKKYEEIKKNNYILFLTDVKINKKIILNKIKEKRKEYFTKNEKEFSELKNDSIIFGRENEIKIVGYNNYLLQENNKPEVIKNPKQTILKEENIEMVEKESDKFDLSNIPLPELNNPSNDSINGIMDYYNNCNKIVNILYIYIISASKSNNYENQKKAWEYYQKLLSISKQFHNKEKDGSFFSLDINEFLLGFFNLNEQLNALGYKTVEKNIFKRTNNKENYITWPEKSKIIKDKKDIWQTEKRLNIGQFNQEEPEIGNKIEKRNESNNISFQDIDSDNENENKNYNLNNNLAENKIIYEKEDLEKILIIKDINDNRIENIFDNNEKKNDSIEKITKKESEPKLKVGKLNDELEKVKPEIIYERHFKEDEGINRALRDLQDEIKKKEQNLDLGNPKRSHKFNDEKNIFNLEVNENLSIQELYNQSKFLANQLFIKMNGNGKVKYFDTLVIFLLDPSVYISEEIKLLNIFILCAMTNALNCLEIKYSIVLMGDEEFRCVLKDYKKPHSIEALQRVYECLILRRFRTNIPGCLKYAIEEISNKSEFKYTSFFIFTDGLDKRFAYTQKNTWDSHIFNKKSNSFGFIFLLSSILSDDQKKNLYQIWDKFLEESKNNSHTSIFLKNLEPLIDDEFKKKIKDIFESNLSGPKRGELKNEIKYIEPIFKIKAENSISNFIKNNNKILDSKSLFKLNGSFIKNERIASSLNTNKEPLNVNHYKNNLHQIAQRINNNNEEEANNDSINFSHKFLSIRTNLNRGILEEIFKPNKANLKVLSNTGTEIDIMALILYFLNPVPDPMIYIQDAIGNVKEYAITIIIDTSFSVLNHMNINHSLNTIRVLLSSLTLLDLPSFDLILTGEEGPIVLCSEYPTFAALNEKSRLWELFYQCLSKPISNADLISALQTAFDLKRMRTNNFPSFLFVLTDGLFEEEKQNQLKEIIAKLVQTNIHVIGIGLGIFPFGINKIFGQAIYDVNPMNLLNSILSLLEGNISESNEMSRIQNEEENIEKIDLTIKKLIENKNYKYIKLREELKNSLLTINCYDMLTEEKDGGYDEQGRRLNPTGDDIGLLKKGTLEGQVLLIVMLWSCELSKKENPLLNPYYIEHTNEKNKKCISNSIEGYGVKVEYVLNYEDAINKITKQDVNGNCPYYSVWVLCGPDINQLPDKSADPRLVKQFIDCLILYWKNGGAVALFCENEPFFFQANMFLENIEFEGPNGNIEKTKLRIEGNDPGKEILRGCDLKGNLTENSVYDTSIIETIIGSQKIQRMPFGRNIPQIYEGVTISHANSNNKDYIKPFIPLGRNSSGNICMMMYLTKGKEGDIFIDCGYTKAFINMSNEESSTWRYIQNIAGFLARPEVHFALDEENAKNYRPKGVNFVINKDISYLYTQLKDYLGPSSLFSILILDVSRSMKSNYQNLIDMTNEIIDKQKKNPKNEGIVIFFGDIAKTIIDKKYRTLIKEDIKNAKVGNGTNFKKGFLEAEPFLEYGRNFEERRVLFLTDGEDSNYNEISNTCKKMKDLGYIINIIGLGQGSLFENLKKFASEKCFYTSDSFEEVREICLEVF